MTSFSLEVLLAAILKRGAGGINQNMLDYFVYSLYSQIPEEEQVSVPACSHCFSELIFSQG